MTTEEQESQLSRVRFNAKENAKHEVQLDLTISGVIGVTKAELDSLANSVLLSHSQAWGKAKRLLGTEGADDYKKQLEASLADTNGAEATPG